MSDSGKIIKIFLWLFFIAIIFETLFQFKILGNNVLFPEVIFLLFSPFLLYNYFHERHKIWTLIKTNRIVQCTILYVLIVAINYFYNGQAASLGELLASIYALGLLLSCSILGDKYLPKIVVKCIILSGVICALMVIFGLTAHFFNLSDRWVEYYPDYVLLGDVWRAKGWFRSPILAADFLCIAWILAYFRKENIKFIHPTIVLLLLSVGIALTLIKSVLILVGIILFVEVKKNQYFTFIGRVTAVSMVILYLILSHTFVQKSDNVVSSGILSKDYTAGTFYPIPYTHYSVVPTAYSALKYASLRAGISHFPLGIGGNNQMDYHLQLFNEGVLQKEYNLAPHSTFFGAFGELGIFGLMLVVFLFYFIYRSIMDLYNGQSISKLDKMMVLSILAFMIISGITVDNMNIRHYWILIGILPLLTQLNMRYNAQG